MDPEVVVVIGCNEAINAHDVTLLGALMHDEHRFVDSAGSTIEGRTACLEAWRGFFEAYPDHANVFEEVIGHPGEVAIRGHSVSPMPELDGPALWSVLVDGGLVAEWRVYEDTPANRAELGLSG